MKGESVIDELFTRINLLEEENKQLKSKISETDKLLDEKLKKEMFKDLNEKELLGEIDTTENSQSDKMEIDNEKPTNKINPNLEEVQIIYTPYENIDGKVYVQGELTKWEKKEMRLEDGVFHYNIQLLKGYKYFFSFLNQETLLIDFTQDFSENVKTG